MRRVKANLGAEPTNDPEYDIRSGRRSLAEGEAIGSDADAPVHVKFWVFAANSDIIVFDNNIMGEGVLFFI